MKKWIAALLSAVMLVSVLTASVSAKPGDDTEPTETTSSTETSPTTPSTSPVKEPSFSFVNNNGKSLTVKWNASDLPGVSVVVVIDGTVRGDSDSTGSFSVPLDELRPGLYDMTYQLSDGRTIPADRQVDVAGQLTTKMTLTVTNGQVSAQIKDNYGRPIKDYPINLFYANVKQAAESTDANGMVTFRIAAPSDQTVILCTADNRTVNSVSYVGCTASLGEPIITPTTTTTTANNTTTGTGSGGVPTTSTAFSKTTATTVSTTTPTYAMIQGAGTTAVVGDQIAINTSFDTQVAKNFGLSSNDFAGSARLLLGKDLYNALIGQSNAVLMLEALTSSLTVTDQHISAAISGQSKFSTFSPQSTLRIPLDLSLHMVNSAENIDTPIAMPGGEITVELPVPKSMSNADKYMVVAAVIGENGITRFIDTAVENGSLSFTVTSLSSVAILGFESPASRNFSTGGIPWLVIVIIILGVLMLVGAGLLLYFFFLRKPAADGPDDPDGTDDPDGGVRPFPSDGDPRGMPADKGDTETAEETDEWEQTEKSAESTLSGEAPLPGVSLGSLTNQPHEQTPRKKNPTDYDIDL